MATRRLQLHELLTTILGSDQAYFQPPESVKMVYPAIVYSLDSVTTMFADNEPYLSEKRYQLILIDKDPDSDLVDQILSLPMCRFDRYYTKDNLNHYSFTLYF